MKTRARNLNLVVALALVAVVIGVSRFVFAANHNEARVSEVIRDVRVLPGHGAARVAIVNDLIREGTAVRTGTDSRAELTFTDRTLTRLGANTVFSFGIGARAYDLGSGAILMSAPKENGTIKISTAVANCAVSGFTGIWETHKNTWNKVLFFEGDGSVTLKKNPSDPREMHSGQMLIFRPDATVLPQPIDFSVCKAIGNGLLITGFKNPLPSMPLLVGECEKEKSQPGTTNLVDPTSHDVIDQATNAQPEFPSPPRISPPPTIPPGFKQRP